jgi:hypothetical protein
MLKLNNIIKKILLYFVSGEKKHPQRTSHLQFKNTFFLKNRRRNPHKVKCSSLCLNQPHTAETQVHSAYW